MAGLDFEETRKRECKRKRRYSTEREARDTAEHQMREGGPRLDVYECIWCRGWHLTKAERPTPERRRL